MDNIYYHRQKSFFGSDMANQSIHDYTYFSRKTREIINIRQYQQYAVLLVLCTHVKKYIREKRFLGDSELSRYALQAPPLHPWMPTSNLISSYRLSDQSYH